MYSTCQFYCLSFRTQNYPAMQRQFQKWDLPCIFSPGVQTGDRRLLNTMNKRQWANTYSHLDILYDFCMNNTKPYAVICEDDICFHLDFAHVFKKVLNDFNLLALDLLLLSYQLPYKLDKNGTFAAFTLKTHMPEDAPFKYYNYPSYLYGTQMYLITRPFAMELLTKHYGNYASNQDRRFLFDKILFKAKRKAILYPMLALENNDQTDPYHILCRQIHDLSMYENDTED